MRSTTFVITIHAIIWFVMEDCNSIAWNSHLAYHLSLSSLKLTTYLKGALNTPLRLFCCKKIQLTEYTYSHIHCEIFTSSIFAQKLPSIRFDKYDQIFKKTFLHAYNYRFFGFNCGFYFSVFFFSFFMQPVPISITVSIHYRSKKAV